MVRIRKKTSKRGTSHQRAKIRHKVTETHRKTKRDAKRNPQWKSRIKKDPGIPSSLPFRAEILAEVGEQRRKAEEDKLRKREARKAAVNGDAAMEDIAGNPASDAGAEDGISSLPSSSALKTTPVNDIQSASITESDDEPSILSDTSLPDLKAVLAEADAVLHLLDARDPFFHLSASAGIEKLLAESAKSRVARIISKTDLAPRESSSQWAAYLRKTKPHRPTLLFRAAESFVRSPREAQSVLKNKTKGKTEGTSTVIDNTGKDAILTLLGRWLEEAGSRTEGDKQFTVAVVGLPNSGKSALVNTLVSKAALPIYGPSTLQDATTSRSAQAVSLVIAGRTIRLMDTPGFAFADVEVKPQLEHSPEDGQAVPVDKAVERKAADFLARNKGKIERVKDAIPAVSYIMSHTEAEDLMMLYNTPAFPQGDLQAFLKGVARSIGRMKKGGVPDVDAAARQVLRDWSVGKLAYYTVPPPQAPLLDVDGKADAESPWASVYATADEATLNAARPRKEMKKTGELVKMTTKVPEDREIMIVPYAGNKAGDHERADGVSGDEEEDFHGFGDSDEEDKAEEFDNVGTEDEDEESTEETEDEQVPFPTGSLKRKRTNSLPPRNAPSPKKVAFAPQPKAVRKGAVQKSGAKIGATLGKVGNATAGKKKDKAVMRDGEEAYDFGRFF